MKMKAHFILINMIHIIWFNIFLGVFKLIHHPCLINHTALTFESILYLFNIAIYLIVLYNQWDMAFSRSFQSNHCVFNIDKTYSHPYNGMCVHGM